jgi:fluoride exporter
MITRDGPLLTVLGAVAIGAVLGSWLRWALAYWLNTRVVHLPLGTLASNLIGGYLIGVAVAVFAAHPSISPFWRLALITGFLGGLTTFSTFSAESVVLLQGEHWRAAATHVLAHLGGSLLATFAGIATYRAIG